MLLIVADFASRLRAVREGAGLDQTPFGERIGVTQGHVSAMESGRKTPSLEVVMRISEVCSVSTDWLLYGDTLRFRNGNGQPVESASGAVIMLPIISQRAAAGSGQILMDDTHTEGHLPVLQTLVAGHPRERLRVLEVRGDSMTGVHLFDGDLVVFVHGLVREDGIYVISLDGDLLVKRLEWDRVGRRITVHSENSRYPTPREVPMDGDVLRIEGKVVGWWHRHPY